jgi:eukaryotic-like serine/threonine-protein kinase
MGNVAGVEEMSLWSDFESRVIDGRYRLGKLVRSEGRVGWFETETGDDRRPAIISLTESLNDEDTLLERLHAAKTITHPNVMAVLDIGTAELDNTPLVFAVLEHAEENLGDVLRERALGLEETRQVAESLIAGLDAIHAKGLLHGRMEAASVVAAAETVKLRSDCIQVVGEGASFEPLAAKEVRGLGEVIAQALVQRIPRNEHDPVIQLIAPPFAEIVRRSMRERASVKEIAALLGSGAVSRTAAPAPISPAAAVPPPPPDTPVVKPPANVVSPAPVPKEAKKEAKVVEPTPGQGALSFEDEPLLVDDDEAGALARRKRLWSPPYVIGALAVLVIVLFLVTRAVIHNRENEQQAPKSAPAVASQTSPAPVAPAKPPAGTDGASGAAIKAPANAEAGADSTAVWRVVAYTYNKQDQAEHKAQTIAQKYPQLQPSVFSPKGKGSPYLVTLGGAMDRDAAVRLRSQAIRLGLPGDTFARNYRARP